eukprot:3936153-Pyramimonas_sp.AAC.1
MRRCAAPLPSSAHGRSIDPNQRKSIVLSFCTVTSDMRALRVRSQRGRVVFAIGSHASTAPQALTERRNWLPRLYCPSGSNRATRLAPAPLLPRRL